MAISNRRVHQVGNSLMIIIPKKFRDKYSIKKGDNLISISQEDSFQIFSEPKKRKNDI